MKGKLLLMDNNKQFQEGWDYTNVTLRTEQDAQMFSNVLDMGFEPYAVIHWMEAAPTAGVIQAGKAQMPVIVEKHFFKRKTRVEIVPKPEVK